VLTKPRRVESNHESTMLHQLRHLHAQILALLAELERLTLEPAPPRGLAALRFRLTSVSRSRTRLLEGRLYAHAAMGASAAQMRALQALRADGKEQLAQSGSHLAKWDMRTIEARWADYCAASRAMRAQMRKRVRAEQELLYPLLEDR